MEAHKLDFEADYDQWRSAKLESWPNAISKSGFVSINDPQNLMSTEIGNLHSQCADTNFALYRLSDPSLGTKEAIRCMVKQLGMVQLDKNLCADNDSISTLKVMELDRASGYIPYTENALNWHTDGYYNDFSQHIRSFLLHCAQCAEDGGENIFINHELIYIRLHDQDPRLSSALMQADAMTIPANLEKGTEIRGAKTGPVFYRDAETNALQMRYTARTRSILWKEDALVRKAVQEIKTTLKEEQNVLRYTLQPGEGLICNNILHGRTAFTNGSMSSGERVMYRVRSYNRLFDNY